MFLASQATCDIIIHIYENKKDVVMGYIIDISCFLSFMCTKEINGLSMCFLIVCVKLNKKTKMRWPPHYNLPKLILQSAKISKKTGFWVYFTLYPYLKQFFGTLIKNKAAR